MENMDLKRRLLSATVSCLALAAASGAWAQEHEFNIPAQGLDSALTQYSEQSDQQVLYASAVVEGREAPAVIGTYTEEEALDLLLDDELTYMQGAGDAIIIRTAASEQVETINDDNDNNNGDYEDDSDYEADEVIVTGTNIRGVENPTVPVLQFDREDIDLSGAATLDDFLRTIPQNFASETQLTAESGNPNDSGRNQTQGTSVDLRGLGAGSTLTLLNGRRMTAAGEAGGVDINIIPLGAIERVEVLTDGATAVYGSDAVGGVINFITRKDYEGFDINARYGTVTEGSKEDFGIGGAGGFNWGSGNIFAGVDYQETKPLLVEERDFVDLSLAREGATFGSDSERFSVSGSMNQELGSRLRFGLNGFLSSNTSESFSLTETVPLTRISEQKALTINSSLEYDVTDRITAALFMDYGRNRVDNTRTNVMANAIQRDEFDNDLFVYEGRLSGQLTNLPGGVVSFSLGGSYREEEFENLDEGVLFVSGSRNIKAGYGELLIPVFGEQNALPFIQGLELSLAGRYEDYSDFGDSFDPKIGVYWEVNDGLSFRASYSEAFRAPDLISLNADQLFNAFAFPEFFFTSIAPDEPPVDFLGSPAYIVLLPIGGNPNLQPERAKTWSAGFSYEPSFISGFTLSGNYFNINYTDRLEFVSFLSSIQDVNFSSLADVSPDLSSVQAIFDRAAAGDVTLFNFFDFTPEEVQVVFAPEFTNVAERDVSGFDVNVNYTTDMDFGRITVGANASYLIDYIGRVSDSALSSEQINILYRPVDFKVRGNLSWTKNGFTAFAAFNYVDGYRDNIDSSIANGIDAWTTVDLSLAYDTGNRFDNPFTDDIRIGFSVTNLFDNDPPFAITPFGINFDTANANPFGRQINFTISKKF